jgi:hypothetical protein
VIASPGSQGEFIYTGTRPSAVKGLRMANAAAAATLLGQDPWDEEQRRRDREREREEEERRRRDRDSSSFRGYPSAY